jgi:putative endopeptidase
MKSFGILFLLLTCALNVDARSMKDPEQEKSSLIPARRDFQLNPLINPCDDFHQYVCSQAEESFALPADRRGHTFSFSDSAERILEVRKQFLAKLTGKKITGNPNVKLDFQVQIPQATAQSPRISQIAVNYNACMNIQANVSDERFVFNEIQKQIAEIKTVEDFLNLDLAFSKEGKESLFAFFPMENLDDPKKYDVAFYVNLMRLSDHDYYEKADLIKDYEKIIQGLFQRTSSFNSKSQEKLSPQKRMERYLALEKDFVKIFPKAAERRQRWSQKRYFSKEELAQKYSALQIQRLYPLFSENNLNRIPIPEGLDFLQQNLTPANLEVWKDVLLVHSTIALLDDSDPQFYNQQFEFRKKYFGGAQKRPNREERCTRKIESFNREMDVVLIDQMFPNFPKEKFISLSEEIRKSIIAGLNKNTWLSRSGKNAAIEKITKARMQLIQPLNEAEWDFQPLLTYDLKQPVRNSLKLAAAQFAKTLAEMKLPVNQDKWEMNPLTVNAYYDPSKNKFVMPIGILQYPFFSNDISFEENLGAVGAVIGHELGHGIDDQGSKYDATGKLNEWLTEKDRFELGRRSSKLIEQFNQIEHNGTLTLGENIGDLVGLSFAYQAAFPNAGASNPETIQKKRNLFIGYARLWCEVKRPQMKELQLKTDPHALGSARINEQVKHQPGFAEAFSCPAGSKMSLPASDRVQIW